MKMFALYDTVEKQFATCLEDPIFGESFGWSKEVFEARMHKTLPTMKAARTKLIARLELNVTMLVAGEWEGNDSHFRDMKKWSIECEKRKGAGHVDFGMIIVQIGDENCTVTPVKL